MWWSWRQISGAGGGGDKAAGGDAEVEALLRYLLLVELRNSNMIKCLMLFLHFIEFQSIKYHKYDAIDTK